MQDIVVETTKQCEQCFVRGEILEWPAGGFTSFHVARDLLTIDFTPVPEDSDGSDDEIAPPPALSQPAGLPQGQAKKQKKKVRRAETHRLAQPQPNSPCAKLKNKKTGDAAGTLATTLDDTIQGYTLLEHAAVYSALLTNDLGMIETRVCCAAIHDCPVHD